MYLEILKNIAKDNYLDLYEMTNGTYIFEFLPVGEVRPILLSADGGLTWCPEAMTPTGHIWGQEVSLTGNKLECEIVRMYTELKLGNPIVMLKAASGITDMLSGKLFS